MIKLNGVISNPKDPFTLLCTFDFGENGIAGSRNVHSTVSNFMLYPLCHLSLLFRFPNLIYCLALVHL